MPETISITTILIVIVTIWLFTGGKQEISKDERDKIEQEARIVEKVRMQMKKERKKKDDYEDD